MLFLSERGFSMIILFLQKNRDQYSQCGALNNLIKEIRACSVGIPYN